jgi:diguanylate cyclase (GGDEF)-like protein
VTDNENYIAANIEALKLDSAHKLVKGAFLLSLIGVPISLSRAFLLDGNLRTMDMMLVMKFLIILSRCDDLQHIDELCNRLLEKMNAPIEFEGLSLSVGASIGVAYYPDHADNATELRKKADKEMYRVKRSGKNNFSVASR